MRDFLSSRLGRCSCSPRIKWPISSSAGRNIDIYKVMSSPEHEGFTEPSREPEERRGGKPRDLFTHMADNAIDCIEGRATSLSTGEDSLKTLEILLAIQQSAAGNGRRIDLD